MGNMESTGRVLSYCFWISAHSGGDAHNATDGLS